MPSKREIQDRRREAIRKILMNSDPPIEDQKELLARLKEMGIPATQSSLSRDLIEMGVLRITGHYQLPSWFDEESPFQRAKGLVLKMLKVEQTQLLLVTQPGAGGFVAEALEATHLEDVLATHAGYSSVLVFSGNVIFRDVVWHHLNYYLSEEGEGKEKEAAKADERPGNT
jgi:transcriptional regulator of arginine metabolism